MKITKRIAKEVHNEKQKSYEEGYENGKSQRDAEVLEIINMLRYNFGERENVMFILSKLENDLSRLKSRKKE